MQRVYKFFLRNVRANLGELQARLGDQWPVFRDRLTQLAGTKLTDSAISLAILDSIVPGPAGDLLRSLMSEAFASARQEDPKDLSILPYSRYDTVESPPPMANPPARYEASALVASIESTAQAAADAPREITVTGHTVEGKEISKFARGETYKLRWRVDAPTAGNLAAGDTAVEGVPQGGLNTKWIITSPTLQFVPDLSQCKVEKAGDTWRAEFDLLIPEKGPSGTRELAVVGPEGAARLLLSVYTVAPDKTRELYREVTVNLTGRLELAADQISKSPQFTHLQATHEWTTPAEHIQVSIRDRAAEISTKRYRLEMYEFNEKFDADDTTLAGAIGNLRASLERFREDHTDYLENLNSNELIQRISAGGWHPFSDTNGWHLPNAVDPAHLNDFDVVQKSKRWRALASDGYALFDRCFPEGSQLRRVLQKMLLGSRIDFLWTQQSGAGFLSHVPWGLMYMEPVGIASAVDPEKFLGLRFRIGSRSWPVNNGSVVLGGLGKAHAMNILYWGRGNGDEVGVEADWQAGQFAAPGVSMLGALVPDPAAPDLKQQVRVAFESPSPSPVAVIYFYCHCSVGDGSQPLLRFGETSKLDDVIDRTELSQLPIADGPLIFANACSTSQADPHMSSELEQAFFKRGVRAFIGTETKVPIKLASKFAWLYFQFLYRTVDKAPMSAGEALTQARMFLWTQYRNIGGLFYGITNQYDLYLASPEEVLALR